MELGDLALGLEVLEGTTDGDGAEGVGVEVGVGLEDVDRRLRGEQIALLDDLASDLTWFGVVVCGDGERWSIGRSFDGGRGLWGWSRGIMMALTLYSSASSIRSGGGLV